MEWMTDDPPGLLGRMALAAFVAFFAAFVALDMVQRAQGDRRRVGLRWVVGVALGLGTGLWAAHVVALSALAPALALGYHPVRILGAWGLAMAVSMACLGWITHRDITVQRVVVAGTGLGVGMVATLLTAVWALGLQPAIHWKALELIVAFVVAMLACTLALGLFFQLRIQTPIKLLYRELGAAAFVALGLAASEALVLAGATMNAAATSAYAARLSTGTLAVLAAVGSVAVLLAMTLASLAEARSRHAAQRAKGSAQQQAVRDTLTDLPNRQMFETTLAQAVQKADAAQHRLALLFINIDGFKPINESFGHRGGDRILREMARRLRTLARPHMAARLGGDEYLLLLPDDPSNEEVARQATRVLDAFSQPCRLDGRETTLSCSIGIAMYPDNGALSRLIAHADAAMRSAKGMGGASYCFFEARMSGPSAVKQVDLLRDLRLALAQGELQLFYQPKIDAPSGEITAAEALLRWHHPTRGIISPGVFIPIAERFGLIGAIGEWVISEACRQARIWRDEGLRMRVAINLSVHQLRKADLPERIEAALKTHGINPQLLTCEITESDAMEDTEATMKIFNALNTLGVHLSIDDFGTGYSSLSTLRKMRPGELKIDQSFVSDLETSADARAVVEAVVNLAKALEIRVVAEGVETEGQREILRTMGCNELQGYLFAKPMSAKALGLWAISDVGPRTLAFRKSLFKETLPPVLQ
jgi:diguanylate cyclase (GGDEF)-like protein